jgi:hypothetical protein
MCKISKAVAIIKRLSKLLHSIKKEITDMHNHSQHPELKSHANEIKSVNEKLITNFPECLHKPLMKVAHKHLTRDKATLKELTPQEQELWNKFETYTIYQFLTGEPDTVP